MRKILIVDDSPADLERLSASLARWGYGVATAASGSEGLALARERRPDLVLMDIVMPEINGFQATRQLRRDTRTAAIPVVLVSAKSQETDRLWGERQGARGYLTKPVAEATLLATVHELLEA